MKSRLVKNIEIILCVLLLTGKSFGENKVTVDVSKLKHLGNYSTDVSEGPMLLEDIVSLKTATMNNKVKNNTIELSNHMLLKLEKSFVEMRSKEIVLDGVDDETLAKITTYHSSKMSLLEKVFLKCYLRSRYGKNSRALLLAKPFYSINKSSLEFNLELIHSHRRMDGIVWFPVYNKKEKKLSYKKIEFSELVNN